MVILGEDDRRRYQFDKMASTPCLLFNTAMYVTKFCSVEVLNILNVLFIQLGFGKR